jgi:hypothetical protein
VRIRTIFVAMASAAALVVLPAVAAAPPPLIGVNYNHYGIVGCDLLGGVLSDGHAGRIQIRQQLAAMRAAGLETLRLFVWHMHDAGGQTWGVVSSAGGTLQPSVRQNVIDYATDVRNAGFERLEVVFGPMWTNNPIGFPENQYNAALFDENWNLIRTVRPLVKQYGPPSTHFDLLNEGAPSDYLATKDQLAAYDARIYANYVDAFGNDDVTISSIVAWNDQSRISNLIDALRATGRPLPTWFEIHAGGPTLLADLQATDATLAAKGLPQPLALGETTYDDSAGAAAIKQFVDRSSRPLAEVMPWPLRAGSSCSAISTAAPYSAGAYISALRGGPTPMTVAVTLDAGAHARLTTAFGQPLTALESGTYTVTVSDNSPKQNFRLTGPGVSRATGVRSVGTSTWTIALAPGIYRYRSDALHSKLRGSFIVLPAG